MVTAGDDEALNVQVLMHTLGELGGRFNFTLLPECDSTNSRLMALPLTDSDARIAVLATDRQTAGRGRRGRSWLSWPGAGLTFSVLWRFAAAPHVPGGLSLAVGLAVARCLEKLGVEGVQLKWPNDVLIHGKKIAGILVELSSARRGEMAAVIGIGLNRRLPPDAEVESASGVTDLAACLPVPPGGNRLLALLLTELAYFLDIYASAGFTPLRAAWQQRHAFADLPVRILGEGTELSGVCAGVDEDGALLLDGPSGRVRVLSGEVSLRLA